MTYSNKYQALIHYKRVTVLCERKINRLAPSRAISLIFEKAEWWYSVIEGKGDRIFHEMIFRSRYVVGSVPR